MGTITPALVPLTNGTVLTIRTAQASDAKDLLLLMKSVAAEGLFMVTQPEEITRTNEESAAWIQEYHDLPNQLLLAGEINGMVVGQLNFSCLRRQRVVHSGEFGMSVAKEWRGLGVGTALLQTLLAWAAAHPVIEKVCLMVFATNTSAIALYRQLGFQEEGRRPRSIKLNAHTYVDELLMYQFVKPFPPERA